MHDVGTPVYPERFFHTALKSFGELAGVLLIRVRGEAQAAAITVRHGRRVEVSWAAATGAAKRTSLSMRMYWELLPSAIGNGGGVMAADAALVREPPGAADRAALAGAHRAKTEGLQASTQT